MLERTPASIAPARQRRAVDVASGEIMGAPVSWRAPARLRSSSSSTVCERRSTSASRRRATTPAAALVWCALASSRRKRRPVSGVRSWCEASATNSRCAASSRATPVGHLVERPRASAARGSPYLSARIQVAARYASCHRLETAERLAHLGGNNHASKQAQRQHAQGDQHQPELGAAHGAVNRCDALGDTNRPGGTPVVDDRDRAGQDRPCRASSSRGEPAPGDPVVR